jgi:hypothetical protein
MLLFILPQKAYLQQWLMIMIGTKEQDNLVR